MKNKYITLVLGILAVLLFYIYYRNSIEGFSTQQLLSKNKECPNKLVRKNGAIELSYSNKKRVAGVNPVEFNNLEDYKQYLEWQKANGTACPILSFQDEDKSEPSGISSITKKLTDQTRVVIPDKMSYSAREHPLYDAGRDDPPFNSGSFAGFDPEDQNIGVYTRLDKIAKQKENSIRQGKLFKEAEKIENTMKGKSVVEMRHPAVYNNYSGTMTDRLSRDSGVRSNNYLAELGQTFLQNPGLSAYNKITSGIQNLANTVKDLGGGVRVSKGGKLVDEEEQQRIVQIKNEIVLKQEDLDSSLAKAFIKKKELWEEVDANKRRL